MKNVIKYLLLGGMFCCMVAGAEAQNGNPQVIPALKEWIPAEGRLSLPAAGEIVVPAEDKETLGGVAEILADDLHKLFGWEYSVSEGAGRRNAICLSLCNPVEELGGEGYRLRVGDRVSIEAPAAKGVLWGTRTLLQMLFRQPGGLDKGMAVDAPEYAHRGFMIDVARKFFPLDYLRDYVRILSFYKMNELQVHLNDNGFVEFFGNDWNRTYAAFRLESEAFPGLTAKDGSYTKAEFRAFQKEAARYGVTVIPEIDVPAHSLAFTHYNPRLASGKEEYGADHLDLYKKEVYEFLDTLFAEYLSGEDPVFVGKDVHIGTDEYNVKEAEQFRRFTNHYLDYVARFGKNPRIWGSLKWMKGQTPVDVKGKTVNAWSYDWLDVETALKEGYRVMNMCDQLLYIVPSVDYYHDFLDHEWLYDRWTPRLMDRGNRVERVPGLMGGMFAVWNDRVGNGISCQDVHVRTFPALQVVSEKLWRGEGGSRVPYADFEALCRRMPEAPGVNLAAKVEGQHELTRPGKEIRLCGTDTVGTALAEIGYPYAVEFELCADSVPAIDAILFRGPHSEFVANWQNTGKFAFRRDGYEFVFHAFRLPAGQWAKVRVEGDVKGTSLYVDGRLQERLEGRVREVYNVRKQKKDRIWYQETLVFPLGRIGDPFMGFKGRLKNLRAGSR